MRLLMTADAVGGVWTYALELCRALQPFHVEVTLATMGPRPDAAQRAQAGALENVTLRESDFALEWMDDAWPDVARAGEWLRELEEEVEPDIVHLNGYSHGALPWRAPVVVAAHSCVLSWWRAVYGEDAPQRYETYRRAVRRGVHAASLVVAPTAAMLAMLREHYGSPARARVIWNGRDPAAFVPMTKEPFVFSAGRLWDEAKNLAVLDAIAPALTWEVRVAGASAGPVGEAPVVRHVRTLGVLRAEALADQMARAAIYALPALYEPFGLGVLEAALSGCALVLGDLPSLRELWDGVAMFVPPRDAMELARAIEWISADEARRASLSAMARARALTLSADRMAAQYLAVYHALGGAGKRWVDGTGGGFPATTAREGDACAS